MLAIASMLVAVSGCDKPAETAKAPLADAPPQSALAVQLLHSIRSGTFTATAEDYLARRRDLPRADPDWPTIAYLLGEAHLRRGERDKARERFRALVAWSTQEHPAGPYRDTWGGSGLAAAGLWRWLQLMGGATEKEDLEAAIKATSELVETRLAVGMVRPGFVPAMPFLGEDIRRRLAHLAWRHKHPEAPSLFVSYLVVNSSNVLDPVEQEIKRQLVEGKKVQEERLELFFAKRLLELVKTDDKKRRAEDTLYRLWANDRAPADVRAEAGYEWANARRLQSNRAELIKVLNSVLQLATDEAVADQARFRRGMTHNRGDSPQDFEAFRRDMLDLAARPPASGLADDALYQMATYYLFRGDVDAADQYFARLRDFPGRNDFVDSAYFLAGIGFVGRGGSADLEAAGRLFDDYLRRFPNGVFRTRCLFWQARIAEKTGAGDRARQLFSQIVGETPHDYYSIRAGMHLESGAAAAALAVPPARSSTRDGLRKAFLSSKADRQMKGQSVYHGRLRQAIATDLYSELTRSVETSGQRLDDIPLQQLDRDGLLPAALLLTSLRQDALAARDADLTADNLLQLAAALGFGARDWVVALELSSASGETLRLRTLEMQRDPRYLATLYPDEQQIGLAEPFMRAAWDIGGRQGLSQSLMYSVARYESRFHASAVSQIGALGLFQIMPSLFEGLNRRWQLVPGATPRSAAAYLLEPGNNVDLWARWVKAEFPVRTEADIVPTLMKHQAGAGNVKIWNRFWKQMSNDDDLEYRIETARFAVTRNFVRNALRDTTIVDASGMFDAR